MLYPDATLPILMRATRPLAHVMHVKGIMSDFPGIPTPAAPGTPYGRAPGTPGPSVRASPSAPAPSAPGDIRSIRREASAHAFRLQAAATMLIGACSALMCM